MNFSNNHQHVWHWIWDAVVLIIVGLPVALQADDTGTSFHELLTLLYDSFCLL